MKKKLFKLFLYLLFFNHALASSPLIKKWDFSYGGLSHDDSKVLIQTSDKGYLLGGSSISGISGDKSDSCRGNWDYWIIKTDSVGVKQWDKTFGGAEEDAIGAMMETPSAYFIAGSSQSDSSGDKNCYNYGSSDFWLVKIDKNGNKIWDKNYGGNLSDQCFSMIQTNDGNILMAGVSESDVGFDKSDSCRGNYDYWIIKIDSLGNRIWDKTFGGSQIDALLSVVPINDSGFLLCGWSWSDESGDKSQASFGQTDMWVIKIDSVGNKIWDKIYGGSNFEQLSSAIGMNDSTYILFGDSRSGISGNKTQATCGTNFSDFWVVTIDNSGNIIWDKDYGSSNVEESGSIAITNDNCILLTGRSYSQANCSKTENNLGEEQMWAIKIKSDGTKIWDKTLFTTGHDEGGFGLQGTDNSFLFFGTTPAGIGGYKSEPSNGGDDYWIINFEDTTAITNVQELSQQPIVSVFPNPFEDGFSFRIYNSSYEIINLSVYDMMGREMEAINNITENTIAGKNLGKGIYIIELRNEEKLQRLKIVKN